MAEKDQRRTVVKALRKLHATPVENPAMPGTGDMNYIDGWLELKWLRAWPKRKTTKVRIDHMTPQQREWLNKRWKAGGKAHILLQCKREWLIFEAPMYQAIMDGLTKEELIEAAVVYWRNGLDKKELLEWAKMPRHLQGANASLSTGGAWA